MSDLISREAALEALRKCQTYLFDERDPDKKIELRSARWAIEDLPSAQPEADKVARDIATIIENEKDMRVIASAEPKKGKWEITEAYPHNVYCSECHVKFAQTHWAVWEDGSLPRKFCPNCGVRMEGEEDGQE